jgi:dipeptidyl aminopeptidase/acylaminoacyl peptidase
VITIHGDKDPTVPYSPDVRLQQALTAQRVPNKLVTVPGGVHGSCSDSETLRAFREIWKFLDANGIEPRSDAISRRGD